MDNNGPVNPRQGQSGAFEDYDIIVPPLRQAKIGGQIFDVSEINTKIAFEVMQVSGNDLSNLTADKFSQLIDIGVKIFQMTNPEIDREWVLENTNPLKLINFITFAVQSINSLSLIHI
jgi:hypothetical protein